MKNLFIRLLQCGRHHKLMPAFLLTLETALEHDFGNCLWQFFRRCTFYIVYACETTTLLGFPYYCKHEKSASVKCVKCGR